jgi:hypothetical protein
LASIYPAAQIAQAIHSLGIVSMIASGSYLENYNLGKW